MKVQKQLSKKVGKKIYHKYVVVLPENLIKKASFRIGKELRAEARRGLISLKPKMKTKTKRRKK